MTAVLLSVLDHAPLLIVLTVSYFILAAPMR